jgi:predicted AAA+ superfamily ATPase
MELRCASSYRRTRQALSFWRSKHGHEVDFIVDDEIAVEVKASPRASLRDARGLLSLMEEGIVKRFYLVSQDSVEAQRKGIQFVHWQTFMERLWNGML